MGAPGHNSRRRGLGDSARKTPHSALRFAPSLIARCARECHRLPSLASGAVRVEEPQTPQARRAPLFAQRACAMGEGYLLAGATAAMVRSIATLTNGVAPSSSSPDAPVASRTTKPITSGDNAGGSRLSRRSSCRSDERGPTPRVALHPTAHSAERRP
jgi:hypothetical protein